MTIPAWTDRFREPDARWRPMPLWVWNDDMAEARIDAMLDGFRRAGFGGVYVHPRPGLVTDYLSPDWFRLWRHAADGCRARGLHCEIYDENSYPSGFAGGHTIAAEPGTAVQLVRCRRLTGGDDPGHRLIACSTPEGAPLPDDAWRQATPRQPVLVYTREDQPPDRWTAHRAQPDLSRPEATRAFLACTHQAYARALGDHVGATTRLAFTDEPTLKYGRDSVLCSPHLARAFRNDHGYQLEPALPALFCPRSDSPAVRRDYFWTANRLFCANFFRAMGEGCAALGLGFTGHVNEHHWPAPEGLPSVMAALRWMHAPGNDLLGFQFDPAGPQSPSVRVARVNLHQLDSIARQCARALRLVESCGGGGHGFDPNRMKPLEDWLLAFGVNQMNPHLAHTSCAGARKYDYPQTISEHSPWFADYRDQADHVARVVAALEQGTVRPSPVLVLDPCTSGWVHYAPGGGKEALAAIREGFFRLVETLDGQQLGYDLGDECVLAELGAVEDGQLRCGACRYRAVVLPACMTTIESSTCALLESFLAAGGTVYAEGVLPPLVDGRPSPRAQALAVTACPGPAALAATLRAAHPPAIAAPDGGALPAGLAWRLVDTAEGALAFLANPWTEAIDCELVLSGAGLLALDSADGSVHPLPATAAAGRVVHRCRLAAGEHQLVLATAGAAPAPALPAAAPVPCATTLLGIGCDQPNLLPLDYAEVELAGEAPMADSIASLDRRFWQAQGFEHSLWSNSIQYRRTFLELDFSQTRPFTVRYRCQLDDGCPHDDLALAIERPWLYRIAINGRPLDGAGESYFDGDMRRIACGHLLQTGGNLVTLAADRLQPMHELAPLWLLGGFGLRACASGFAATAPAGFALGDLGPQGRPCYRGTVDYRFSFTCAEAAGLALGGLDWSGVCLRVAVDGRELGRIWRRQAQAAFAIPLAAGTHELHLACVGDCFNAMGPHHAEGLPNRWTWERSPVIQPPGSAYRRRPHGLMRAPGLGLLPR